MVDKARGDTGQDALGLAAQIEHKQPVGAREGQ